MLLLIFMPCTEYISELKKKKEVKRMEVSVLPNWCYTEYAFYGDDAAVKRLGSDIRRFISKNYMENGFGKNWLGNIVLGYGFPYKDILSGGSKQTAVFYYTQNTVTDRITGR